MANSTVNLSLVVPTKNAGSGLGTLARALAGQDLRPLEVLVIDSGSTDNTVALARGFARVVSIPPADFDHGATRQLGAELTSGEVLVYLTQDALPRDKSWLSALVRPLEEDPQVAACFSRQVARPGARPLEVFARRFNYPEESRVRSKADLPALGVKTFFFSDVSSAIRRSALEEIGGFPRRIITSEDMAVAARLIMAGYKIKYVAESVVIHSHSYSLSQTFKRYFDIGVFYSQNRWIYDLAGPGGEGIRFVLEEMKYLWSHGQWQWLPYAVAEAVCKYGALRLGLAEKHLLLWLKKRFSMNENFWRVSSTDR